MEKEWIGYLQMMEERMNQKFENALKPIKEQLDETNKIVKSILHGQTEGKKRLETMEKSTDSPAENNLQKQINTIEHRLTDIDDSIRLAVRQTSGELCGLKFDLNRVKTNLGMD